jgi:hypothetical protein
MQANIETVRRAEEVERRIAASEAYEKLDLVEQPLLKR